MPRPRGRRLPLVVRVQAELAAVAPEALALGALAARLGEVRYRVAYACWDLARRGVLVRCGPSRYALREAEP